MIELIEPEEVAIVTSPIETALATVSLQVAAFEQLEAGFVELEKRYKGTVYDVKSTAGMDAAKKARAEIRQVRFNAQNKLKETTQPLNQLKADITKTAEDIVARIFLTETPIDDQIKVEETRKAAEKAEREQVERELAAKVQVQFDTLLFNAELASANATELHLAIEGLSAIEVSLEVFGSRAGEAMQAKLHTLEQLGKLHGLASSRESAAAALAVQQAELDEQRRKFNEEQAAAVASRMAEDLRLAGLRAEEELRIAAERAKLDADLAAARKVEQDKLDDEAKLVREAAAAAQKLLDDAAAAERQKADDLAASACKLQAELDAIERAEFERSVAEKREEEARIEAGAVKLRNAAPVLLAICLELSESASYWSEYDVPLGIVDRLNSAIKLATGE